MDSPFSIDAAWDFCSAEGVPDSWSEYCIQSFTENRPKEDQVMRLFRAYVLGYVERRKAEGY